LVLWFNALAGETKRFMTKPLNNTTFIQNVFKTWVRGMTFAQV
jgi:hypothetical protein